MRTFISLFVLVIGLTALSFNADAKMFKASVDPATHNIDAYFDGSTPILANDKNSWLVILAGTNDKVTIDHIEAGASTVKLVLSGSDQSTIAKTNNIVVCFSLKQCLAIDQKEDSHAKPIFSAAKDKKTADVYMKLGYSPAIGSPPQYSIDTAVALLLPVGTTTNRGYLGGLATVNTDNRQQVDPDSFRVFLAYQYVLSAPTESKAEGIVFTWLPGGGEFERKANNLNFISSPMLEFPLRLFPKTYTDSKQPIASLVPLVGAEFGENFTNAVTHDGLGGLFRGLLGVNAMLHFNPKLPGFQGIQVSSSYKIRLPAVAEVFTNTATNSAGKVVDVPSLSTKARNYVKSEIDFVLVKSLSFSITHEHGELPPAFRVIGNKVTIGLTYSLAVNRGASDSLRDK